MNVSQLDASFFSSLFLLSLDDVAVRFLAAAAAIPAAL